jgi:hypothetical protein
LAFLGDWLKKRQARRACNFNEFSLETALQVSRKLEIRRLAGRTFLTNQIRHWHLQHFGVEAWNSTRNESRPLELHVTNRYSFSLSNVMGSTANLALLRFGAAGGPSSVQTGLTWLVRNRISCRSTLIFFSSPTARICRGVLLISMIRC